jgi:transcription factor MBP1
MYDSAPAFSPPSANTSIKVPVYELKIAGDHVMRRRSDDWINATHILKLAGYDKPARTRILEREVQKGVHEKIQGGYGKYQGQLTSGRSGVRSI